MSDFNELEAELKRLRPCAASPELTSRIAAALAQEVTATPTAGVLPRQPKAKVSWFALGLSAAGLAALVMIAVLFSPKGRMQQASVASTATPVARTAPVETTIRPRQADGFVPDGLTRVVYHTRDEGLVYSGNAESPVRRRRSRARETLQWKEPATGASLRVSYPTEEVELIPVFGQ